VSKTTFPKEFMQNLVWGDAEDATVIERNIAGHSRWSVDYDIIFQVGDKYYSSSYSVGATESQDERPFQYDEDEIEVDEVIPVVELVTVWKEKPNV